MDDYKGDDTGYDEGMIDFKLFGVWGFCSWTDGSSARELYENIGPWRDTISSKQSSKFQ